MPPSTRFIAASSRLTGRPTTRLTTNAVNNMNSATAEPVIKTELISSARTTSATGWSLLVTMSFPCIGPGGSMSVDTSTMILPGVPLVATDTAGLRDDACAARGGQRSLGSGLSGVRHIGSTMRCPGGRVDSP